MYLIPLNCTLKDGQHGKVHVMYILPQYERFLLLFFNLLLERERVREQWGWDSEKGRQRIPSRLGVVGRESHAGLEPRNRETMAGAEIKSRTLTE